MPHRQGRGEDRGTTALRGEDTDEGEQRSWMETSSSGTTHGQGNTKSKIAGEQASPSISADTVVSLGALFGLLVSSCRMLSYPEFFTNKSCFEVGSGVGLNDICLEYVKASKVIMNDGVLSSLANLKASLKMNQMQKRDM
ncbi:hypothetical protein Dimus_026999, partial [Dionaea muscipula]